MIFWWYNYYKKEYRVKSIPYLRRKRLDFWVFWKIRSLSWKRMTKNVRKNDSRKGKCFSGIATEWPNAMSKKWMLGRLRFSRPPDRQRLSKSDLLAECVWDHSFPRDCRFPARGGSPTPAVFWAHRRWRAALPRGGRGPRVYHNPGRPAELWPADRFGWCASAEAGL